MAHHLGTAAASDDPDGPRPRAAVAGRQQHARVHQPRAGARRRSADRSAASAVSPGQGNGQGGREHGQKADQLPGYRRIDDRRRARAHGGRLGHAGVGHSRRRASPRTSCSTSIGRGGGVRALLVMGSNIAVSAPERARRCRERLKALEFLVVADFFLSETAELADVVLPCTQWAEEEGTLTNLEGRVLRRRKVAEPPAGVRSDLDILVRARPAPRPSPPVHVREQRSGVRGAAPREPRRPRGLLRASRTSASKTSRACSGRVRRSDHPGTERLFADSFPTPNGRARFHAVSHRSIGEEHDRGVSVLPHDRPRPRAIPVGNADPARRARCRTLARQPFVEMHPATARVVGVAAGDRVVLDDQARLGHVRREDDDVDPRGHGVRAVPLGRRAVGEPADQRRARSHEQDARVQGLRDAD